MAFPSQNPRLAAPTSGDTPLGTVPAANAVVDEQAAPSLTLQIRQDLAPLHDAIEQTPFARALVAGSLTPSAYGAALKQLLHLHQQLESALQEHPELAPPFDPSTMRRTAAIQADLHYLQQHAALSNSATPMELETTRLLTLFADWTKAQPSRLLGALYVFEGSRLGSAFLCNSLAQLLQVEIAPGHGLDYHLDGREHRGRRWQEFKLALEQFAAATESGDLIRQGACDTMAALLQRYQTFATQ